MPYEQLGTFLFFLSVSIVLLHRKSRVNRVRLARPARLRTASAAMPTSRR
jgi:hypothetical protein